ncbi:hypothetical protein MPSEU_000841600 [Mayamaea pseudoterrestris]|nr:hypothetical protein MPSEU_000841600 [Mayamaea pseudoterrestris]
MQRQLQAMDMLQSINEPEVAHIAITKPLAPPSSMQQQMQAMGMLQSMNEPEVAPLTKPLAPPSGMQQQMQAMGMLQSMMAKANVPPPTSQQHEPVKAANDMDDSESDDSNDSMDSDYDSSDESEDEDEVQDDEAMMADEPKGAGGVDVTSATPPHLVAAQDLSADDMEEDSESDSESEDSDSDEDYSNDITGSELGDMTGDGSSWCSDDSESDDYDDLMADLMGGGNTTGAQRRPTLLPPKPTLPAVTEGLVPIANADEGMNPMEGLAMLQNIRSELEQVGRMIVTQKTGEKFLQRAHILASINWLATNVPSCVLDHLGQEIREGLKAKEQQKNAAPKFMPMQRRGSVVASFDLQFEDDESEASELSDVMVGYNDDDDELSLAYPSHENSMRRTESLGTFESKALNMKGGLKRNVSFSMDGDYSPSRSSSKAFTGPVSMFTSSVTNSHTNGATEGTVTNRILPSVSHFECALLFVDISGFTQLSTMLDPENLSKTINQYFEVITKTVSDYEGDIQKFAGDALFCEWRVTSTRPKAYCVDLAAHCAAHLVNVCADFPVMAFGDIVQAAEGNGSPVTHLNVHCGLGIGSMAGIHIGDSANRREYVYLGDPIQQATNSCNDATFGQAVASKQFIKELLKLGMIESAVGESGVIAHRSVNHLQMTCHSFHRNANSRGVTEHVDGLEVEALIEYRRLMSLYVHPVVVSNDVAAADGFKSSRGRATSRETSQEESELRSVYVMFMKPTVSMNLSGNSAEDKAAARLLNNIMLVTTRELKKYHGHLRQTILDDKGLVLIATFGLRGSTFPNLVSERALPASVLIHNALLVELGVDSRIGCTFGDVYCGPVGGVKRNEYAVMGPSVNLAARLMSLDQNAGILVDIAVRQLASQAYGFNALPPVAAKGYKDPVPIFEPLAALDRSWGRIEPNFVGRTPELTKLVKIAREMASAKQAPPRIVMVSASSGLGKSTFLTHSIEHIRRAGVRGRILVAKNVGSESHALIPFTTIRPILMKVLGAYVCSHDQSLVSLMSANDSCATGSVHFNGEFSVVSETLSREPSISEAIQKLMVIAESLNVPSKLTRRVQGVVLEGNSPEIKALSMRTKTAAAAISEMVTFISQIFRTCTRGICLNLIAIDDIHHADAASWLVLRNVFETADNFLIIGTNYATTDYTLHIDESFAEDLNSVYSKNGRFENIELGPLSKDELELMTMKTLGLQKQEVDADALQEVVIQSGGSPHFATKILRDIKDRMDVNRPNSTLEADEGLADIILHRFDTFDLPVRNTLNVGAVMGSPFRLGDILAVLKESSDMKDEDLRLQTVDALKLAVKEGILIFRDSLRDNDTKNDPGVFDNNDTEFLFRHNLWRNTLLGLMLNSRQRHVHRKVAQAIEAKLDDDASFDTRKKLFLHWKSSGDTGKASNVALTSGKALEQDPAGIEFSVSMYKETLQMWGWEGFRDGSIAGFSSQVLDYVAADDVASMISLLVAYGGALSKLRKTKESVVFLQDSLRVVQSAKAASKLEDRSIMFPAYTGLANALTEGQIQQDAYCRYEASLILSFMKETRTHGRLIHHIYALYLQMQFYSKRNQLQKAIAVHSVIKQLYKPEKHSMLLRKVYGIDAGALSFCLSSHLQMVLGDNRQAIRNCRNIVRDLLPRIQTDFLQSFAMMYSLVFVLNENGYSAEARGFFEKVVVLPFGEQVHETEEKFSLLTIYEPLVILLNLSVKGDLSDKKLDEYRQWALNEDNLMYDAAVNTKLGRLGRCADSVGAEICLLVAAHLPDCPDRNIIITNGTRVALAASIFDKRNGLTVAHKQVYAIANKLKVMNPETGNTYLEC